MTRVREWKAGDVAMIRVPLKTQPGSGRHEEGNGDLSAVRTSSGGWAALTDVDYYWEPDYAFHDADPRPLVVIDPEDREQIERLWDSIMGRTGIDDLSDALREFADPKPRIEEPTGLGAVVEAVCGCGSGTHRFIHDPLSPRFEGRPCSPDKNWKAPCGHHKWSDLDAVRVLSEGVTA